MNNFTQILEGSRKNYDSHSLLQAEVTSYLNKVNKIIPIAVKDAIHITQKYGLFDRATLDAIKEASKSTLKQLAQKYSMPESEIETLKKMLRDLKTNINLMPQYQTPQEREMIEKGQLSKDELTIDLETPAGRNAAAKVYMPLAYKIVGQFVGKSRLSKQELMSAALMGMTDAMNQWNREGGTTFKTYVSYRIRQQILNDINAHGHSLSGFNDYALKKGASADAVSLDSFLNDEGDEYNQDHLAALGVTDKRAEDAKDWEEIYKLIDANFSSRDAVMFYRAYGFRGYKKEKSKDLAKELGMSEGNFSNVIIRKILNFLRTNKQTRELLSDIVDSYNESLMVSLFGMDKDAITESFINDDIFILLEELSKWFDKNVFKEALENALLQLSDTDSKYILNVLQNDFDFLDGEFKKHKKVIILFLNQMYPTESMNRKSDVALLDYMVELQDAYKKHSK